MKPRAGTAAPAAGALRQWPRSRRPSDRAPIAGCSIPTTRPRIYSDDQVAAIHAAALSLLETKGMKVLSAIGRQRFRDAGRDRR